MFRAYGEGVGAHRDRRVDVRAVRSALEANGEIPHKAERKEASGRYVAEVRVRREAEPEQGR